MFCINKTVIKMNKSPLLCVKPFFIPFIYRKGFKIGTSGH